MSVCLIANWWLSAEPWFVQEFGAINVKVDTLQTELDTVKSRVDEIFTGMTTICANQIIDKKMEMKQIKAYLEEKYREFMWQNAVVDNYYEEAETQPAGTQKMHKQDMFYYPQYGGAAVGHMLKVKRKITIAIDDNGGMSQTEDVRSCSFEAIPQNGWWGGYLEKDSETFSNTSMEIDVSFWVMAPKKSELAWFNYLFNFTEQGNSDLSTKMKLYPQYTTIYGMDFTKMFGFKSSGSNVNDEWVSQWWKILLPEWNSKMGGPK